MEGTGKYNDVRALCVASGDLDGIFICLGTAVGEEGTLLTALDRNDLIELFCQCNVALMCHNVKHTVEESLCLLLDSFYHSRLAVSDIQDTDASDPVKEVVAIQIFHHGSLTTLDRNRISTADGIRNCCMSSVDQGL